MTYHFLLPDLGVGGAERVCFRLAHILKEAGEDVRFVCLCGDGEDSHNWLSGEFKVSILRCSRVFASFPRLLRFLSHHRDTLLFSTHEHVSIVALLAGKLLSIPVVVRMPTMPSNKLYSGLTGMKWRFIHTINHWLLPQAKAIVAQTDEMRKQVEERYHLPKGKVVTINNPIDPDDIRARAAGTPSPFVGAGPHFLSVGNISLPKGVDTLVEAFHQVRHQLPEARLTIVGRNDSAYARNLLGKLNIDESINLVGFQSNPYPFMKYCDVFVLSSRMEGFPNVLLEAMCFDKPIASTTCVPIVKELVKPGVNGYYCNIEAPSELADCMVEATHLTNIHNHYDLFDKSRFVQLFH
ncbi:MAG: glycosyltransferase [Prevotella sp.]|nr:glycosyltransferase [Prevotella sp.]